MSLWAKKCAGSMRKDEKMGKNGFQNHPAMKTDKIVKKDIYFFGLY